MSSSSMIKGRLINFSRPCVMGILNVTPDSFSDGGKFLACASAVEQALKMIEAGAAIIDIGGESTRPGASAVSAEQELARVIPIISAIRAESDIPISIDTSKPEVMREAVQAGADLINDVRALREPGALEAAAELGVSVCLMHMQGEPRTMQAQPVYEDVVADVKAFLVERTDVCLNVGISAEKIIWDPGFGFGKNLSQNLALMKYLGQFTKEQFPVLIGVSRKSMFDHLLSLPVDKRLSPSLAAGVFALLQNAKILRVHDVEETVHAVKVLEAINAAN